MGHWEQTGRDNAKERERITALPAWRRALSDHGAAALTAAAWIVGLLATFKIFGVV